MKEFLARTFCVMLFLATCVAAQDVLPLYLGTPPGSAQENYPEKEYFSKTRNTEVVANVTKPTLTVFKPSPESRNGTAVVICPGGGFMALSITNEGTDVAKYLAERGVTAFVLKYRLAHRRQRHPGICGDVCREAEISGDVSDGRSFVRSRWASCGQLRSAACVGMGGYRPNASVSSASPQVERSLPELLSVTRPKADPPL
jgi:hypothetical protein